MAPVEKPDIKSYARGYTDVHRVGRFTHGKRFAQRRTHVRSFRSGGIRVLRVGCDLELDVVVFVELWQGSPFRSLERIQ